MEKRNKSLRAQSDREPLRFAAQLDSLQRELASVRKSAARNGKKERLTDLQRVDQTSARLRKQNKDMRLQLESVRATRMPSPRDACTDRRVAH
eukprot:1099690-Pleurochrysis_carterae.AAC.2